MKRKALTLYLFSALVKEIIFNIKLWQLCTFFGNCLAIVPFFYAASFLQDNSRTPFDHTTTKIFYCSVTFKPVLIYPATLFIDGNMTQTEKIIENLLKEINIIGYFLLIFEIEVHN